MTSALEETITLDNEDMLARYCRAENMEREAYIESMVLNPRIYPHWISDSHCFWYISKSRTSSEPAGQINKEYRLVDAKNTSHRRAFDHEWLAQALSHASGVKVDPDNLPISQLKLELSPFRVIFTAFEKRWVFESDKKVCKEISANPAHWLVSPDGKQAVFVRDFNLWVRNIESGVERALTQDGDIHYAYATPPERTSLTSGLGGSAWGSSLIPEALWSPDSKWLLTIQTDERQVLSLPVTEYVPLDGGIRPRCVHTKYALPGDEHIAEYDFIGIEVETCTKVHVQYPSVLDSVIWNTPFVGKRVWWSSSSCHAYFVDMARGLKQASVVEIDIQTGATRILFEERSETYIDLNLDFENPASLLPLPDTNELIWFSERSGWAHIYLYDLSKGVLKNPITSGNWVVREVLHFDSERREVFIQVAGRVAGRNPYYRELCRVNVDTGSMVILASSNHDYIIYKQVNRTTLVGNLLNQAAVDCFGVSPDGNYIVVTRTRADEAPVSLLIDRGGNTLLTIESADISGLPEGWKWPEPFKFLSSDGTTDIYGLLFRPSDFVPDKHYPVLDLASTNPFYAMVPTGAFGNDTESGYMYMSAAAYAELGFITVIIDGRGSCYRSKAFHDESYGCVHKGSDLEDHIQGIRKLSTRYPSMDLDRVAIVDTSGSNAPAYGVMAFPDFYKVGAVISTWDVRLLIQSEIYQGVGPAVDYDCSVLGNMAGSLSGKLLLIHGMLDPIFPASGFFQLVDALVRENSIFDMVVLPAGGHAWNSGQYGLRRVWDYLVTHLHGCEPPQFKLCSGLEFATEKTQPLLE